MKTLPPSLFQFLGVLTNGDYADLTFYTNRRGRLVFFPKTWPKDPATFNQGLNRDRWRHAAWRWRTLSPETRHTWKQLATAANLTISGHNLYMHYILGKGTGTVRTCQRNTGINVIDATGPPIPFR